MHLLLLVVRYHPDVLHIHVRLLHDEPVSGLVFGQQSVT
jgi:hypothetical protein